MKPSVWRTDDLIRAGITFQRGKHWWTLCNPRKAHQCRQCGATLRPARFCYLRRTGAAAYLCQPCGRVYRDEKGDDL